MATYYVDSNATGANNGTSWTDAWTSLVTAVAGVAAGDTIQIASDHSEEWDAGTTNHILTFPGTQTSPNYIISTNKATGDATVGAIFNANGPLATYFQLYGHIYVYGVRFNVGDQYQTQRIYLAAANEVQEYEECTFYLGGGYLGWLAPAVNGGSFVYLKNCHVGWNGGFNVRCNQASEWIWDGGTYLAGSSNLGTNGFISAVTGKATLSGFKFLAGGTSFPLCGASAGYMASVTARNCQMPSGWNGSPVASVTARVRVEMYNCDSGDTNYKLWVEDLEAGDLVDETVIVRSGGATDGATPVSWRLQSSSGAGWQNVFRSGEIAIWNETVGSAVTVTAHVVHDSVGGGTSGDLTDKECWLEVMVLDTSGFPLGGWHSDRAADYLDAAADQTDDSATTWTTTGLTTPVKQKLSVSVTPQEKGYIIARVCLAKPSTTVYVCPKVELS